MPVLKGYQCDSGCGASVVLQSNDNLNRNGWHHVFPAEPGQLYFCSWTCLSRYAERKAAEEQRMVTP